MLQDEIDWFRRHNRPVRLWICKARRAGMSTGCEANIFVDTLFYPGTRSLIVSNQISTARVILKMCHDFWKYLPDSLRPDVPSEFRNKAPKDSLPFPDLDCNIQIATAKSVDQYLGDGFHNVHATEVARWEKGDDLMTTIYPAVIPTAQSMFFGESTARGQGNFFHEQCMLAYESKGTHGGTHGGFRLLFVPWHALKRSYATDFETDKARRFFAANLDDTEKSLMRTIPQLSLEQLHWRRGMIAGPPFNNNEELFDQEFPSDLETAFLSTGATVFTRAAIKRMSMNKREPEWVGDIYCGENQFRNMQESDHELVRRPQILTKGDARAIVSGRGERFECTNIDGNWRPLKIWRRPERNERIAVCCDVGGGLPDPSGRGGTGDYSTMAVVAQNIYAANEVIMTWRARIRPVKFAVVASALCWWLRQFTGDDTPPLLAPEWNGVGAGMNSYIDDRKLYSPHFLYITPGVKGAPKSHHYGFESNGKTIPVAMAYLQDMIEKGDLDIPDADAVLELSSYKKYPGANGDEYAGEGSHDDFPCALRIAAYLIRGGHLGVGANEPARLMAAIGGGNAWSPPEEVFDRFESNVRGSYATTDDDVDDFGLGDMDWG